MSIIGVSYAGKPLDNTAMYISKKVGYLVENLCNVKGCKVFIENGVEVPENIAKLNEFIFTDAPQREYAKFVNSLYEEKKTINSSRKYSLINGSYFGENVVLGEGTVVEPGCFIDHDVVMGKNCMVKSGARIRETVAGDRLIVCENATVGTTGFTMADDEEGNKVRIPTLGKVIIGNNVEINSLANISCGSAGNTVLCDNVKIDSLVHIGHDVYAGKNVEIPAGAIVGGFDVLEEGAYVGINATLRNRIRIGRKAFVGMGAVVTKSVDDGITVVGNPAKPFARNKG